MTSKIEKTERAQDGGRSAVPSEPHRARTPGRSGSLRRAEASARARPRAESVTPGAHEIEAGRLIGVGQRVDERRCTRELDMLDDKMLVDPDFDHDALGAAELLGFELGELPDLGEDYD